MTGITDYLQQCRHVLIHPEQLDKDGKQMDGHWFDEPWVVVIKKGAYKPEGMVLDANKKVVSGAPDRPHPPAREHA